MENSKEKQNTKTKTKQERAVRKRISEMSITAIDEKRCRDRQSLSKKGTLYILHKGGKPST